MSMWAAFSGQTILVVPHPKAVKLKSVIWPGNSCETITEHTMPEVGLGMAERLPKGPDNNKGFRGRGRGGGRGGGRGASNLNIGAGPVAQVKSINLDLNTSFMLNSYKVA